MFQACFTIFYSLYFIFKLRFLSTSNVMDCLDVIIHHMRPQNWLLEFIYGFLFDKHYISVKSTQKTLLKIKSFRNRCHCLTGVLKKSYKVLIITLKLCSASTRCINLLVFKKNICNYLFIINLISFLNPEYSS